MIPIAHVVETMRPLPLDSIAAGVASPFVAGVAVIRGAPVVVVEVAALLGAPARSALAPSARFVTVRAGDRVIALLFDEVTAVRDLPDDLTDQPRLLTETPLNLAEKLAVLDAQLALVLDSARILESALPAGLPTPDEGGSP